MKVFSTSLFPLLLISSVFLVGCSSKDEHPMKEIYRVSPRQLPPEATYSRLRWVHLPETHPSADMSQLPHRVANRPKLLPVVHFTVEDLPMCEAATVLSGLGRYATYCSSKVKDKTVSLDALGTIDELAELIEQKYKVNVVVDHPNREVRFLSADTFVAESFFEEEGESSEEHGE